jgi:two-component system phosphate regulon sensor histidine kinase PhoR
MEGGPEPGAVLAVFDDVTEFRRLDEIRRDFVANASHELKTPLAAIQGYAEMLSEDTGHADAAVILNHARRMSKLVEDLLALSRLEARSLDLKPRPFALGPFIGRAVQLVRPQAEAKAQTLAQETAAGPAELVTDEEALLQVLVNLLDNAVTYTPAGGRVTVLTRIEPDGRAALAVRDTGPGIPPEHLPRLFERFYRVDKARSRELGGTGLGLAIVKHLAERLGGEAYIESRPGEGTEAGLRLPLGAADPGAA